MTKNLMRRLERLERLNVVHAGIVVRPGEILRNFRYDLDKTPLFALGQWRRSVWAFLDLP